MAPQWVENIRAACKEQGVAFFFKQWGGAHKGRNGRLLDGRTWDEHPVLQASVV
jgi:protein gp37